MRHARVRVRWHLSLRISAVTTIVAAACAWGGSVRLASEFPKMPHARVRVGWHD